MKAGDLDITDTTIVVGLAMGQACQLGMRDIASKLDISEVESPAAVASALVALIEALARVEFDGNFETAITAIRAVIAVHDAR